MTNRVHRHLTIERKTDGYRGSLGDLEFVLPARRFAARDAAVHSSIFAAVPLCLCLLYRVAVLKSDRNHPEWDMVQGAIFLSFLFVLVVTFWEQSRKRGPQAPQRPVQIVTIGPTCTRRVNDHDTRFPFAVGGRIDARQQDDRFFTLWLVFPSGEERVLFENVEEDELDVLRPRLHEEIRRLEDALSR